MIRIIGCIGAMIFNDPMLCVYLFGFAEILGIAEELFDERGVDE